MKKVLEARQDVTFYIKLFPLVELHPEAYEASMTIACAGTGEEALKLLEKAYAGDKLDAPTCTSTVVDDALALGKSFGINGTPALVFSDGTMVQGALKAEQIMEKLDEK